MPQQLKPVILVIASLLFFLSGFAALIYQVLWMKELSLLFGNSAQAAAATLAAFFTGIAAGNAYWGQRCFKLTKPLVTYGLLECCITISACLYFAIYLAYDNVYPFVFSAFSNTPVIFTLTKFLLAFVMLFPAAFFMGGTLPVMTQYFVHRNDFLGKRASMLYAINTFGAACGALSAGFVLPQLLGINFSYLLAMSITLVVGITSMLIGRNETTWGAGETIHFERSLITQRPEIKIPNSIIFLAGLSGFATLALQVLWIRMFVQVLQNSVYTYATILTVFLIALGVGGTIARELARRQIMANWVLPSLLTLSALLVAVSAMLFYRLTNGAAYISGDENFIRYIFEIFSLIAIVIGLPTIVIGVLLPYLFKLTENFVEIDEVNPGAMIGRLITVNTVGAILGSIIAGFILLELIGLWASITLIAVIYSLAAAWFSLISNQKIIIKTIPIITTLLLLTVINPLKLPVVKINSDNNETLLKVWEGADATVAVVEREGYIRTKLNNWYSLGGTGDMLTQQMQTHLPLLLHPNPKDVFYLGLGTGITAGTALDYNVEHVTVAELAPSVIRASEEFFSEHTNNLYDDPRVTVVAEDGRNVLRGSGDTYDLIISDLFIPWKAGTGTLYSVNHYAKAQQRLNTDGLYVQWLPLYQLTKDEFDIIARTMLEIFPMLTLWRGNFWGDKAVVALIGHQTMSEIDPSSPLVTTSKIALNDYLTNNSDIIPLFAHYITSLTVNDSRISAARLNTDSNSVIEYFAPINHRREKAGLAEWFVGEQLLNFIGPHLSKEVLARDPYLSNIDTAWYDVIHVGYYLQTSYVLRDQNNSDFEFAKSNYQSLLKQAASQIKVLNNN